MANRFHYLAIAGWAAVLVLTLLAGCGQDGVNPSSSVEPIAPPPDTTPPPPDPSPVPKPVAPLVWDLAGSVGLDGTLTGTITYAPDAVPYATDVRNLAPNALYHLVAWDLTVTHSFVLIDGHPLHFSSETDATLPELCVGICIFHPEPQTRLWWSDGLHTVQLVWLQPVTGLSGVPLVQTDWGTFEGNGSWVRIVTDTGAFAGLVIIPALTITPHVTEAP